MKVTVRGRNRRGSNVGDEARWCGESGIDVARSEAVTSGAGGPKGDFISRRGRQRLPFPLAFKIRIVLTFTLLRC